MLCNSEPKAKDVLYMRSYRVCLSYLVLSWEGEVSAVSRDAIEDARHAKCDTVIDEWDEEFDRGKVRRTHFFRSARLKACGHSLLQLRLFFV